MGRTVKGRVTELALRTLLVRAAANPRIKHWAAYVDRSRRHLGIGLVVIVSETAASENGPRPTPAPRVVDWFGAFEDPDLHACPTSVHVPARDAAA
jgi:hypothetical protein